jgi:ferrochelatase
MRYRHEPAREEQGGRIGILLVNLGTPDAPTAGAVRRYLAEFLADPRVVELPAAAWRPILHGVILRVRPRQSAAKYAQIWHKDGSPLLVHSQRQKVLLQGYLGQRLKKEGLPADLCAVELGMRYGNPSLGGALARLRQAGCSRILALPLYPQHAGSTTGSAFDGLAAELGQERVVPALRFVDGFHADRGYIHALARNLHDEWMREGRPDHLVLSFHGLPRRAVERGDPYETQCRHTAELLAKEAGLEAGQWTLAFQSRFGRARWLEPYTVEVLRDLARRGTGRVDVYCPGFVADCLETLEEIGLAGREAFTAAGGKALRMIPCLNEHPAFIGALADIVRGELRGWLPSPPAAGAPDTDRAHRTTPGLA